MRSREHSLYGHRIAGLLLAFVAAGCVHDASQPAAKYGAAEDSFTTALVPLAELPHRLCVRRAQYNYLWEVVRPVPGRTGSPPAPDTAWPDWYRKAGAVTNLATGRSLTWERNCNDAESHGQTLRKLLHALKAHAHALASLAASSPFDTSGLESFASGAASLATTAGAPSSVEASVKNARSGVASFTTKFVALYRQGKLDEALEESDACVDRMRDDLTTLVDVLKQELQAVQRQHDDVLAMLRDTKWAPADSPGHLIGEAVELALETGTELARESASLDRYGAAIQLLAAAHHQLAERARGHVASKDIDISLATLNATIDDLLDEEWNR